MNLPLDLLHSLNELEIKLSKCSIVTGGDINEARCLVLDNGQRCFLKYNTSPQGTAILKSEAQGLALLSDHKLPTPAIIHQGTTHAIPFLLLQWIEAAPRHDRKVANALAKLHKETNDKFGLDHDNYIGSLPQSNALLSEFSEYYIATRIAPQVKLAIDQGYGINVNFEKFQKVLTDEIPNEAPALIHGDLWSGNLMDGVEGPVFIDPSVSYGHREMDLAMMRLFGGFGEGVFHHYVSLVPLVKGWRERADLFQLYYLLVHLNLFGAQYRRPVERIFKKYLA